MNERAATKDLGAQQGEENMFKTSIKLEWLLTEEVALWWVHTHALLVLRIWAPVAGSTTLLLLVQVAS